MKYSEKIIGDIEVHDVEGIRECFENGVNPNSLFRGEPLINELTSEYKRSKRFKDCVKVFVDFGLEMNDDALLAVLLDDHHKLELILQKDATIISNRYSMRCAYTPFLEVSLLHICAEFNQVDCAKVLVAHGADVNAQAGVDEFGFGGQTPIFHTVNQNQHQSFDMMQYLLSLDADLKITVAGFIWGKGYDWETLIPSVNPVSYAMMGLLPQMHRDPQTISRVVTILLEKAYQITYTPSNVPCRYLLK